jgi:hypothetical protein
LKSFTGEDKNMNKINDDRCQVILKTHLAKLILHGGGEDGIGSKREELSKSLIRKITPTIGMLQYLLCSIIII